MAIKRIKVPEKLFVTCVFNIFLRLSTDLLPLQYNKTKAIYNRFWDVKLCKNQMLELLTFKNRAKLPIKIQIRQYDLAFLFNVLVVAKKV